MIISHKYKFIFFCNPKTGTTSLERALREYGDVSGDPISVPGAISGKHIPPAAVKGRMNPEHWDAYFKFVFVRHPLDWVVSQIRSNHRKPRYRIEKVLRGQTSPLKEWSGYRHRVRMAGSSQYSAKDIDYIFRLLWRWRAFEDADGLYQSDYVFGREGDQLVDYIGRFETLNEDLDVLRSRLGLPIEMPHLNASCRPGYKECLSKDAVERIREMWAMDFNKLGY